MRSCGSGLRRARAGITAGGSVVREWVDYFTVMLRRSADVHKLSVVPGYRSTGTAFNYIDLIWVTAHHNDHMSPE